MIWDIMRHLVFNSFTKILIIFFYRITPLQVVMNPWIENQVRIVVVEVGLDQIMQRFRKSILFKRKYHTHFITYNLNFWHLYQYDKSLNFSYHGLEFWKTVIVLSVWCYFEIEYLLFQFFQFHSFHFQAFFYIFYVNLKKIIHN